MNRLFIISAFAIMLCVSCATEDRKEKQLTIKPSQAVYHDRRDTQRLDEEQKKEKQLTIHPSQVIYHDRLDPEPLKEKQFQKLSDEVRHCGESVKNVWFCRVFYNKEDSFTVKIYLKPITTSTRVMKGKLIHYTSVFSDFGVGYPSKHESGKVFDYMYVAINEQAGSETIPIPSSPQLFPFEPPGSFTYQEITEIVDFIRSGPTLKKDNVWSTNAYGEKADSELPIMTITREGENIKVRTGTQEGGLSGSGQSLTIKKNDNGYELISIGMWLS